MIYYMTPETARIFLTGMFADKKELVKVTNHYFTDEFFNSYVVFNVDRRRHHNNNVSFRVRLNDEGDVTKHDVIKALREELKPNKS